jgi:hypothetical protein
MNIVRVNIEFSHTMVLLNLKRAHNWIPNSKCDLHLLFYYSEGEIDCTLYNVYESKLYAMESFLFNQILEILIFVSFSCKIRQYFCLCHTCAFPANNFAHAQTLYRIGSLCRSWVYGKHNLVSFYGRIVF